MKTTSEILALLAIVAAVFLAIFTHPLAHIGDEVMQHAKSHATPSTPPIAQMGNLAANPTSSVTIATSAPQTSARSTTAQIAADSAIYQNYLGITLYRRGKFLQAERFLREAVRLAPDNSVYLCNLGNVLSRQGKLSEALPMFEEAVRLDPANAIARNDLSLVKKTLAVTTH